MSLCIAAHCRHEGEPHIVLCCDWLTSDEYGSAETCNKMGWIKNGWPVLIAGTVHKADEMIGWYQDRIDHLQPNNGTALSVVRLMTREFMEELRDHRSRMAYGSTVPELIKAHSFSRKEIEEISSLLSTGAELIISTIIDEVPFIFEIRPEGEVVMQPDYAIIGSPAQASAFMQWSSVTSSDSLPSVIYRVYEAKRFGEMDTNVGQQTAMYVLNPKVKRIESGHLT